ncbi:hypothetical protein [Paenibacillus agilis]|uniref:DUF4829 domain-containing protein n=1 Tax=Paenibacillus agilis TaxID=3020863 RepID=A0A559J2K6_9BACL|nr:hypothetical protein [Paenibacillus agilis]TVX94114.1 hypothetical protein FPZ44_14265 [Paenibacillus agilis]
MARIFVFLMCLIIVTGCTENKDKQNTEQTVYKYQYILDKAATSPRFLDTSNYTGNDLDVVKTLNMLMQYSLQNDLKGVLSLYAKESAAKDDETNKDVLSVIVSLDKPHFNYLSDTELEVNVDQSQITVDDPEASVYAENKRYYMVKENSEWKIKSIQN